MVRWRLKSCPRCGSDMYIDKDFDNWYEQCLMCSYRIDLQRITGLNQSLTATDIYENEEVEGEEDSLKTGA